MGQLLMDITGQLTGIYAPGEARAIAKALLQEPPLELPLSFVFTGRAEELDREVYAVLQQRLQRLLSGEPFQYVVGHEYFAGLCLEVGPGVLIPRPETQDLVDWIVTDYKGTGTVTVVDACTGSGCIAAALAHQLPEARLTAVDLSPQALDFARRNTLAFGDRVQVLQADVLNPQTVFPHVDVLVSNPPYIAVSERESMADNVKNHEPEMALFVSDEDPLLFYRALGEIGLRSLNPGGAIYLEINSRFGREVCELYASQGYEGILLRNDRFGLPRMVKCVRK